MDEDLPDEIEVDRRRGDDVDDALAIEAQVEEDAVVAELEIGVDEDDLPAQLAVQGDRRVDRDRRRAHAALRAVEREDVTHRRPADEQVARREARQQALDPGEQLGGMERLDQVVVRPGAEALDLLLHLALGGQHDDRDVGRRALLGPDLRRDLVSVDLGKHDVEQDQGGRLGAPQPESLGAVGRHEDLVAFLLEGVRQQPLHIRVIVDDEDLRGHCLPRIHADFTQAVGPAARL